MNKIKIFPLNIDKFALNEKSIKFANYFNCIVIIMNIVNNREIKIIKNIYNSCFWYILLFFYSNESVSIFKSALMIYYNLNYQLFFDYLFNKTGLIIIIIELSNCLLNFNDFFQFVIFFSLAPMASILFGI